MVANRDKKKEWPKPTERSVLNLIILNPKFAPKVQKWLSKAVIEIDIN